MDIVLWSISGLLALMFLAAGGLKIIRSRAELQKDVAYVEDFSDGQVKAIGGLEVAGALGLILPKALGIAEILTPLAALGLFLTMVGAAITHIRRDEMPMIIMNIILGLLALLVALARFGIFA
ncbi:MAG: DoxX family protein [Chloroflexota bacterium]